MKAIQYHGPGQVAVVDIDRPTPDAGQVLIRVACTGICGTDMAISAGKHPRAKPPLTMGHEFSGHIVETGAGVTGYAEGDYVTANPLISCGTCRACREGQPHVCHTLRLWGIDAPGSFAEYVRMPADALHRLPGEIPPAKGALAEPLAVGVHAVHMGAPTPQDRVLVVGAGPIGLITALCLRRAGVEHLLVSDVVGYRLDLARSLGFETIDARTEHVTERIKAFTNGDGADAVYEVSGHESAMPSICDWVRVRGKIVFVSVHKDPRAMDFRAVNFKELTIIGSRCYGPAEFAEAVRALSDLPVEKLISHRLPFSEGPAGFEAMRHAEGSCKVLFGPGE